ncbi:hypothetical protein [Chryseolinea lacunae]|uniref:Uncharacterized protein n=1 Tax=Chryseolinea lacunae TaxID=2801331 RepID=A0ABS1KPN9_9BACT|nr:hypothetical protein [Chryseolinea lacunae]MBL0741430.1 hypothetical protein [Chryseolinea lacunae]
MDINSESVLVSNGIQIDNLYIPPFTLERGTIVVIQLPSGFHFSRQLFRLVDFFTGTEEHDAVAVQAKLKFANHIIEEGWTRFFYPLTVGRYIKKSANPTSDLAQQIYEAERLRPDTCISTLPGGTRKMLSLLSVFSWTDKIVFDLMGSDPMGGQEAFNLVRKQIGRSGAAILIDHNDEFKNDCTKFVVAEQKGA